MVLLVGAVGAGGRVVGGAGRRRAARATQGREERYPRARGRAAVDDRLGAGGPPLRPPPPDAAGGRPRPPARRPRRRAGGGRGGGGGGGGGLHLRLPGRPRPLDVRGRVRQHAAAQPRQEGPKDVDESTDTYDTIDWLLKNVPNHNGKVGLWGISYPGFYAAAGMIDAHPALKAASPQAPVTDWFIGDDFHHNGAFFLPHAFNFMASFGKPRPEPTKKKRPTRRSTTARPTATTSSSTWARSERRRRGTSRARSPFWNEVMEHGTYDEFWKARNLRRTSRTSSRRC